MTCISNLLVHLNQLTVFFPSRLEARQERTPERPRRKLFRAHREPGFRFVHSVSFIPCAKLTEANGAEVVHLAAVGLPPPDRSTLCSPALMCLSPLQFPVGRIHRHLKSRTTSHGRVGATAAVYSAAILEYLTAEVIILALFTFEVFTTEVSVCGLTTSLLPSGSVSGPGVGRKRFKGSESEAYHPPPLAAGHQRRRRAGFTHQGDHRWRR